MTELSFPEAEAAHLRACYAAPETRVILEYGSGGSTLVGAGLPGKVVFSVESDRAWAQRLQAEIDAANLPSPAVVYHVDIGPTGEWGRPVDETAWHRFHRYPMAIWDEPFFRHPDLVLVDGRFRPACLATVCMRITRPVTVLFDDYLKRSAYHAVERLVKPRRMIGRMAEFAVEPGLVTTGLTAVAMGLFSQATYAREGGDSYRIPDPPAPGHEAPEEDAAGQ